MVSEGTGGEGNHQVGKEVQRVGENMCVCVCVERVVVADRDSIKEREETRGEEEQEVKGTERR